MATEGGGNNFGYEQTLLCGQYSRDLGSFAQYQANQLKSKPDQLFETEGQTKPAVGFWAYWEQCIRLRDIIFHKIGEDWVFLALLGIIMALMSFTMDYVIEKCQEAKIWLFEELSFSLALQFVAWVTYSLMFILFATGFTHLVSPQAIGSGIPEMKTILRGVVLKEYLTFRTLVAKIVGLCSSLGSTLPLGKEGPFVHIASIVATLLGKLVGSFRGIYENESRRSEMLAAACAVGVACTFAAPIGGVLFSIEVTATFFAVRNYWRGFFSAVCGALIFRLLAFWFKDEETITALFKTTLRTEVPFDALELIIFAGIGVACGLGGSLFILLHRKIILFTRRHKRMSAFLQKNRFIYPGIIAILISTLTFPPGLGQYFAGQLTARRAINELFSNITWTTGQADDLEEEAILSHWNPPATNIYVTLLLYVIMTFWMGALSNTLPIPAGVFVPVFCCGAAFGRLVGESMSTWFPEGIRSGDVVRKIVPGGYAVVGAAALSGSVTRTISTSVIVFELTGQISHVLPAVVAVLIANAVAHFLQPSFYDSIIRLKRLPYLPDLINTKQDAWTVFVEDIMIKDISYITFVSTYYDLQELLTNSSFKSYPLVDTPESMILLGSIQRFELERLLWLHLSSNQTLLNDRKPSSHTLSPPPSPGRFRKTSSPSIVRKNSSAKLPQPIPRFVVTKVDETGTEFDGNLDEQDTIPAEPERKEMKQKLHHSLPSSGQYVSPPHFKRLPPGLRPSSFKRKRNVSFLKSLNLKEDTDYHYDTLQLPLRSILKKTNSESPFLSRRASTGDLRMDGDLFYRDLAAKQRKESIVEDVPFVFKKNSMPESLSKLFKVPFKQNRKSVHQEEVKDKDKERSLLNEQINWEGCQIDPAPFQLVEKTSLHKVHSLFSLLGLSHAFVTNIGKLVGVVGLKELRNSIQGQIDAQAKHKASGRHDADSSEEDNDDPAQLEVVRENGHRETFTLVKREIAEETV
ncbi:chloride channel protein 2 isoform X1 [Octopus bimaculoides]|nr:chloride channel protein 2 isoform X1 [Octopus bimaculoides]